MLHLQLVLRDNAHFLINLTLGQVKFSFYKFDN